MNIGIASSREYLFFYKTMLRSLVENNKNVKDGINVYYLNLDIMCGKNDLVNSYTQKVAYKKINKII